MVIIHLKQLLYYMVNDRVLWSCFGNKRSFYKCITVTNEEYMVNI